MNYDQITGIIRAIVPAFLGICVAKGWLPASIDASVAGPIVVAVLAVAAAVWSVLNNKTGKTIK